MTPRPIISITRAIAAKGAMVTGVAQVLRFVVNFVSSIFLARLLTPADFGLLAAVMTSLAFAALIQDLGLNQATIQRPEISESQMSALFWVATGFSAALAIVVVGAAPAVAWFFGDERLVALTMACSVLVLLGGLQSQSQALMNREMRFNSLALTDVLTAVVTAAVGITVAWATLSYWALFFASLAGALTSVIAIAVLSRWRPGRPSFEGHFKEILGFGAGVTGFNIVNYFSRNADSLLIGRYYGPDQLGLYSRAYRLLSLPLQQLQAPLARVMLPMLSGLQSNPERYRRIYFESISLLMMALQPGLVFVIVYANDVFLILFGPSWSAAAPMFQWIAAAGIHQVMSVTVGWVFLSQGRGNDYFKIGLVNAIVLTISFFLGLPWGAYGVAVAYGIASYVILPFSFWLVGRRGPIATPDLCIATIPHFVATIICALSLFAVARVVASPNILMCACICGLAYVVYFLPMVSFPSKRKLIWRNFNAIISWSKRYVPNSRSPI